MVAHVARDQMAEGRHGRTPETNSKHQKVHFYDDLNIEWDCPKPPPLSDPLKKSVCLQVANTAVFEKASSSKF